MPSIGTILAVLALMATAAPAAASKGADPAPVIAAERAFAARAAEVGIGPSFLDFMADDAIILGPDPVSAKSFYGGKPPPKAPRDGGTLLAWWPNFAGIARTGDLGFTTGPATINGGKPQIFYFTVWKKQPDGQWKWVYDGGIDADGSGAPGADVAPLILPPGASTPLASATAFAQVKTAEARLARVATAALGPAYAPFLAPDARVQGSKLPPATTPQGVGWELAARPKAIAFHALGGEASKGGDLVWTHGETRWLDGRGHYVRVWQRRTGGWKIVFDQIVPVDPT